MARDLKRILYVEDETDIQTIAVTVLEGIGGYTVITCSSGAQAVAAAASADADLILLDVMMPGLDGPTTLKALREIPQTASTPVVFMTAKAQPNEIVHLRSLGALDVISKPFDPMTLPGEIGEIWRSRPNADKQTPSEQPAPSAPPPDTALAALYGRYTADLPGNIDEIDALWARLLSGSGNDPLALKSLHRALHSIAGSGETFGYTRLGQSAQALELALEPFLKSVIVPGEMLEPLSSMLDRVKRAAKTPDRPA